MSTPSYKNEVNKTKSKQYNKDHQKILKQKSDLRAGGYAHACQ